MANFRAVATAFALVLILSSALMLRSLGPIPPVFTGKYREESALKTTTKRYSYSAEGAVESIYEPCTHACPWESYTPNSKFQSTVDFRAEFHMEDDDRVTKMKAQLACVPFTFGFSREKGEKLFPHYVYPRCDTYSEGTRPTLHLENNTLAMHCGDGDVGRYVLHPKGILLTDQFYSYDLQRSWKSQFYPGSPVHFEAGEFAIGACADGVNQAQLVPTFLPKAYARAHSAMQNLTAGEGTKPIHVVFVAVDSFSRRHFYRKMTETVKVMNGLNAEKRYSVFDFKVHNVVGPSSPENMVPMFGNQTLNRYNRPRFIDYLGGSSLWSIAKDWGFTTFLGFEYCGSNFLQFIGKRLNVDHHVSTFYCGVQAYFGVTMGKSTKYQRCVGPHMSHYYLLNYTKEFSRIYRGVNQFAYIHLDAAHEETGQHAQTLDTDLAEFIEAYTEQFGDKEDVAIFVQGDHGMRFGDWHTDVESAQEHKLPAMFLIANTDLLEKIPYSMDSLWHNTHRLVSKRDFRATILSLFGEPFGGRYPVHEEEYLQDAYILTREKIRDSRKCRDASIDPWYCACEEPTQEVATEFMHSFGTCPLEHTLLRIVEEALRTINEKVFTSTEVLPGYLCKRLTFDSIIRAFAYKISKKIEQINVEFGINELDSARVEAIAIIGTNDGHTVFQRSSSRYPLDPQSYLGYPVNIRVTSK